MASNQKNEKNESKKQNQGKKWENNVNLKSY